MKKRTDLKIGDLITYESERISMVGCVAYIKLDNGKRDIAIEWQIGGLEVWYEWDLVKRINSLDHPDQWYSAYAYEKNS